MSINMMPVRRVIQLFTWVIFLTVAFLLMRSAHIPLLHQETSFRADLPTIVEEMKSVARLESASFHAEKIVEASSTLEPLPAWMAGDRVALVAHGEVVAGIDLSHFGAGDIRAEGTSLHVRLPRAQVFAVRLDDRSYVYDHHPGIFTRVNRDLETEAREKAEEEIRSAALQSGILTRAQASAQTTVERLLKTAGAKTIFFD